MLRTYIHTYISIYEMNGPISEEGDLESECSVIDMIGDVNFIPLDCEPLS